MDVDPKCYACKNAQVRTPGKIQNSKFVDVLTKYFGRLTLLHENVANESRQQWGFQKRNIIPQFSLALIYKTKLHCPVVREQTSSCVELAKERRQNFKTERKRNNMKKLEKLRT